MLRFAQMPGRPFFDSALGTRIPPLVHLSRLLSAAGRLDEDKENDEDLRLLIAPGSFPGGARPKAAVRDRNGRLAPPKLPRRQDDVNIVLWEAVALALAGRGGW